MKVLVLTPALPNTSPGLRFRIEQWYPYLEQEGYQFTFVPFEDETLHHIIYQPGHFIQKATLMVRALLRRLRASVQARDYDVVFLHREASLLGPALVEHLLAWQGIPIVYDFDDPIWLPYQSPSNGLFSHLKFPGKTASICRLASAVVVGNRLLASWASRYSKTLHVVPSTIEMTQYPARPASRAVATVTLGWTGSHSTLPFLKLLEQPLQRLAQRHRIRLLVISHTESPDLGPMPVEVIGKKWHAATEAVDLHDIDIGLAPFPDTNWTPWRCHGKVLQYMAAGIPTVASRIGILPDYISDGEEGFLVTTDEEWTERLSNLITDAALRGRMGDRGRQKIQQLYAAHVWAPRVRDILQSVVN